MMDVRCGACHATLVEDDGFLCGLCASLAPDIGFVSGDTIAGWSRDLLEWATDSDYRYCGDGVFRDEHGQFWDAGDLYDYMVEVVAGAAGL